MPRQNEPDAPARLIDARIEELADWRGEMLSRIRRLIQQADPEVVEEVKWRKPSNSMLGVPVWSHGGMICTGEVYKDKVKLTFAKGASLQDPAGLFNSSLEGSTRRAIDLHEGDEIDESAFKSLVRAAASLNASSRHPEADVTDDLGEREDLGLQEAAEAFGLPADDLLTYLREAGIQVGKVGEIRLQAADVLAIRKERERRRHKSLQELTRLGEVLGTDEAERDPDDH
jgi:hypothetical protein